MPQKYVRVADRPGYVAPAPDLFPKVSHKKKEPVTLEDSLSDKLAEVDVDILVGFRADEYHRKIFLSYLKCRAKPNLARIDLGLLSEEWDELVKDDIVKKGFAAIFLFIVETLELDYTLRAGIGDAKATRDILGIYSDDWKSDAGGNEGIIVPKMDAKGNATWLNANKK